MDLTGELSHQSCRFADMMEADGSTEGVWSLQVPGTFLAPLEATVSSGTTRCGAKNFTAVLRALFPRRCGLGRLADPPGPRLMSSENTCNRVPCFWGLGKLGEPQGSLCHWVSKAAIDSGTQDLTRGNIQYRTGCGRMVPNPQRPTT